MKVSKLNAAITAARDNNSIVPALPTNDEAWKNAKVPQRAIACESANAFQRAIFDAAFAAGETLFNVVESARAKMLALVSAQYGTVSPTYEQFKADRSTFTALALERGLADDQVIRKPYCAAIVQLFGKLPVSDSPAAIAKRMQRPVVVKADKPAKVDTPPVDRIESIPQTIGSFIARFGAAAVLVELAKILATEKSTALDAKALVAVASHIKPAKVA